MVSVPHGSPGATPLAAREAALLSDVESPPQDVDTSANTTRPRAHGTRPARVRPGRGWGRRMVRFGREGQFCPRFCSGQSAPSKGQTIRSAVNSLRTLTTLVTPPPPYGSWVSLP